LTVVLLVGATGKVEWLLALLLGFHAAQVLADFAGEVVVEMAGFLVVVVVQSCQWVVEVVAGFLVVVVVLVVQSCQ
jgi:hypothetical protein